MPMTTINVGRHSGRLYINQEDCNESIDDDVMERLRRDYGFLSPTKFTKKRIDETKNAVDIM